MAKQVRTGLSGKEDKPIVMELVETKVDKLDELFHRKPIRQHILEFSYIFSIIFLAVGAYLHLKGSPLLTIVASLVASGVLVELGVRAPKILYPVWDSWMTLAEWLGFCMTWVILTTLWVFMMVPIAVILKVLSIRVMDTTFREPVESYWEDRNKEKYDDFQLLKRQF